MGDQKFNIELLFKALADPTRLRLINLLGDEEVCVCSCVERLKTSQPKVSRHLAYLRRAGLVTTRREASGFTIASLNLPTRVPQRLFEKCATGWLTLTRIQGTSDSAVKEAQNQMNRRAAQDRRYAERKLRHTN